MSKYKVAVIMPYYNEDKTIIKRAIASIESQNYNGCILITINDGGKRGLLPKKILCNHLNFDLEKNVGPGSARQFGIDYVYEHDLAETIMFLDADDFYFPGAIKGMYNLLCQTKNKVLNANVLFDGVDGTCIEKGNMQHCWGKIFNLQWLKHNNIYFPSGEYSYMNEDVFFMTLVESCLPNNFMGDEYFIDSLIIYHDNFFPIQDVYTTKNHSDTTFLLQMINSLYDIVNAGDDKYIYRRFPVAEMYSAYQIYMDLNKDMSDIDAKIKYILSDKLIYENLYKLKPLYLNAFKHDIYNGVYGTTTAKPNNNIPITYDNKIIIFKESLYQWFQRFNVDINTIYGGFISLEEK